MLTKLKLLEILRGKSIDFQIHEHTALYTVKDSENLRGNISGYHSKNLFLKNKKDNFFLFSCDENAQVDLKKFSKSINGNNLSFAKEEYLVKYLGIKPGSVSPFALLNDTKNEVIFYLDEKLAKSEKINFHPLINTTTISLKTMDFLSFMQVNNKKVNIFSLESYSVIQAL
tara:strand:- start:763 stop:1275 length:513 start_codon:yes stop_codon:yes gene_type:complete